MKYLVAIDGTEESHKAFQIAKDLYKSGDNVSIVTCCPTNKTTDVEKAESLLTNYSKMCSESGMPNDTILMNVDPKKGILDAVENNQTDVLILGTRGMGIIKRALIGSVSQHVRDKVSCDVIIAK
ncbi:hypothetical protein DFA_01546 [Cavenderia fasciculata]|uniref:UspA domain-containing protein n=1 Tax=Cavenderia fasciculata TaxID=261658 RepID=F4PTD8_CACFS|nr:uncharacterized protein DFA_01546 [Cavenderia fasciculata]EGG21660.1 hypothetical protein DFA_01546 [Cavenderia fasciculata]|eukprot:XP_004359510.1 hypothetical protein DFA_01546 [Cavenderia fasciculata]